MKYECDACENCGTCVFQQDARREPLPSCCPYGWVPRWKEIDKPDPQAKGDGEIVKAAGRWGDRFCGGGTEYKRTYFALFRLIEGQIEGVRNWTMDRIGQVAGYYRGDTDQIVKNHESVLNLEHKLGVLEGWIKTVGIHSRQLGCLEESELGRKVEEIEEAFVGHNHRLADGFKTPDKPQPAEQPVARCKDEKDIEHPLIPGVSVCDCPAGIRIFSHLKTPSNLSFRGFLVRSNKIEQDVSSCALPSVTWLFDLPIPKGGTQ